MIIIENLTALYLRLSRDDEKTSESESISNQRAFLTDYANHNGFDIVEIFSDDGYSGTSFDRPAFIQMIKMVEEKKINTIITKDLSRLGRDYIKTGYYLEEYFPLNNIRYIAVNDGIDTFSDGSGNDMSAFRAVFNDMYAKDISKKVRSSLDIKKRNGKFIGSTAPYGYKKDPLDKNHLIIDDISAYFVRKIYSYFLAGESIIGIARKLTEDKVPTPSEYKHLSSAQKQSKCIWNDTIIRRILSNPTYAGNLTQNMSTKINYKVKQKARIPKEKWITVEGTHAGIISQEDFDTVQNILTKRSYSKMYRSGKPHLLTGIVFCKDCGSSMSFVRDSPTRTYLVCSLWRRNARLGICSSHSIREDYVENAIKEKLKEFFSLINTSEILKSTYLFHTENNSNDNLIKAENQKLQSCKNTLLCLYKDKANGVISENDYIEMSESIKSEQSIYQKRLDELQIKAKNHSENSFPIQVLNSISDVNNIDRNTLLMLIDKIRIGVNKEIEIVLKFKNPL